MSLRLVQLQLQFFLAVRLLSLYGDRANLARNVFASKFVVMERSEVYIASLAK